MCDHLGIDKVRRINVRAANENGAVEVRHRCTKKLLKQALILRGGRDFASVEDYERFVQRTLDDKHNSKIEARVEAERPRLKPLPIKPVPTYTVERLRVRKGARSRSVGGSTPCPRG